MDQVPNDCPCCSGMTYHNCCQPYHLRKTKPQTAEKLMRSRYSAFYLALVDYLIDTTHASKRSAKLSSSLEKTKHDTEWLGLEILSTAQGMEHDKIGKVRFIARYKVNESLGSMEEHSRFRRYEGNWVYYDDKG